MENGYHNHGGMVNGSNGAQRQNGAGNINRHTLTVDEALPYSPFSSVVPFNSGMNTLFSHLHLHSFYIFTNKNTSPDIIPLPTIGLRSSASLFSNATERSAARQGLESLNREAEKPSSTSQRLEQTLQDLKQLLQPQNVAQ